MFLILPNGKTIIGRDGSNPKIILIEDITKNDASAYSNFGNHSKNISLVFYDVISKSLFVGDCNGVLIQYKQNESNQLWEELHNYGNLGIGSVISVELIGRMLIFGGFGTYLLKAVDIDNRKVLQGTFKTAIKNIFSLQVCELPDNKLNLSVCGFNPDYSNNLTDIFDVTKAAEAFGNKFQKELIPNSESLSLCETKSTESKISQNNCGCDSKWILNNITLKMDHYLSAFACKMFDLFDQRFISKISMRNFLY
jgi:hypothetical protein